MAVPQLNHMAPATSRAATAGLSVHLRARRQAGTPACKSRNASTTQKKIITPLGILSAAHASKVQQQTRLTKAKRALPVAHPKLPTTSPSTPGQIQPKATQAVVLSASFNTSRRSLLPAC